MLIYQLASRFIIFELFFVRIALDDVTEDQNKHEHSKGPTPIQETEW